MATDYPRVRALLTEAFDQYPDTTNAEHAKKLDVNEGTLSNWRRGRRAPTPDSAKRLAAYLYKRDRKQRTRLEQALSKAAKEGEIDVDVLRAIATGARKLRVGVTCARAPGLLSPSSDTASEERYKIIGPAQFLTRFFQRLAEQIPGTHVWKDGLSMEAAEHLLLKGDIDIVVGVLNTRCRALRMRIFSTPLRLPVNGVVLREHWTKKHRGYIRKALRGQGEKGRLRPIVSAGELGEIYSINILGYAESALMRTTAYTTTEYVKRLKSARAKRGSRAVPIVIADELDCARIVDAMKGEGVLAFPMKGTEEWDIMSKGRRPWLPSFRLGIAVRRDQTPWIEYLQESFVMLVDSDAEWVQATYQELHEQLLVLGTNVAGYQIENWRRVDPGHDQQPKLGEETDKKARVWAESWVREIMSLDEKAEVAYGAEARVWKPILDAVAEARVFVVTARDLRDRRRGAGR